MNMKNAALIALLLYGLTACDRGGSVVQTSEAIAPPPQPAPVAATPTKSEIDYPGSIDVFSKVGAGKGRAIAMVAGQKVSGRHVMERGGNLVALGVRIGTYHGAADGSLRLSICVDGKCEEVEKSVAGAVDNDYLVFELPTPVAVTTGSHLDYELTRSADTTRRVAVWSYPKLETQPGMTDPAGQEIPMVPRLSLHLQ